MTKANVLRLRRYICHRHSTANEIFFVPCNIPCPFVNWRKHTADDLKCKDSSKSTECFYQTGAFGVVNNEDIIPSRSMNSTEHYQCDGDSESTLATCICSKLTSSDTEASPSMFITSSQAFLCVVAYTNLTVQSLSEGCCTGKKGSKIHFKVHIANVQPGSWGTDTTVAPALHTATGKYLRLNNYDILPRPLLQLYCQQRFPISVTNASCR